MPRPLRDSLYIYGFHDPGGEQHMLDLGVPGWVLVTEAIGFNPTDQSGADYRRFSDRDLGVIVRLNAGYNPTGTLPPSQFYANFARRCANFVRASTGAHIWIIGNEPNHPIEWPGSDWDWNLPWPQPKSPDRRGEEITPARYADAYRRARAAIKAVPGHENDQVLVAGPAPWNILLTYPGNPNGDWVLYLRDTLAAIGGSEGARNLDGISLHAYTHGSAADLIRSEEKMGDARFANRRFHFRVYQDFMAVVPESMRHLPVYITESNQGDQAWANRNTGWVRAAYGEIDAWNRANREKIRALLLYRWPQVAGDRWGIDGKAAVIEDFRQALAARYQWAVEEDANAILERKVSELEQAAAALQPAIAALAAPVAAAARLRLEAATLATEASGLQPPALRAQYDALAAQVKQLEDALGGLPEEPGERVPEPNMIDKVGQLPTGTAPPYGLRSLAAIRRIVVHHTATRDDVTPERLAEAQVGQGRPGITYHYLITGDGTIYATQALDVVPAQTGKTGINQESIGIALAGNFTTAAPQAAQLAAAANLIAWLLSRFSLTTTEVVGRRELENIASPGAQWQQGAAFKTTLLVQVQAIVDAYQDPDVVIAQLQARVRELETQNRELAAQAGQIPGLEARIRQLEDANAEQAAEIKRLRDQLAAGTPGRVAKPAIVDLVDKLPKHPTLPPYEPRSRPISMIVIHHTDTTKTTTVQSIAQYHVYGERRDANGNLIKAQWPGVGYHFLVGADGVIYQGQRESTRSYHVGGDPNDYSVAISLIGRMMTKDYDGTTRAPEDQVPTPAQLRSAAHLAAWLMQEYKVPLERVMGHRDVWPKSTVCPGEHWKTGRQWYADLVEEIQAVQQGRPAAGSLEHYLLFWDRGGSNWAQADWRNAQAYLEHFRTTAGFSVDDALLARHVTIVGGDAGVTGEDEARLAAAGVDVHRLAGTDEADTRRLLNQLVAQNTPWPGAPARPRSAVAGLSPRMAAVQVFMDEFPVPDEWTMPDDWQPPAHVPEPDHAPGPEKVIVPLPAAQPPAPAEENPPTPDGASGADEAGKEA